MSVLSDAELRRGWIADYHEQGMEALRWRIFQDERFAASATAAWQMNGMAILQAGDELTIFSPDRQILWSGVLCERRLGWRRQRRNPQHPDWSPPSIAVTTWDAWFHAHPPLAATLRRPTP